MSLSLTGRVTSQPCLRDDRPRRRGLNEVEPRQRSTLSNQFYFQVPGDYYDSIELGEEGDMDYTYDDYV